jgi:hypothetical protein
LDGRALAEATLSLSQERGGSLQTSVLSGDDGSFVFENLPAGKYSLRGRRRGFIEAAYNQHEQFWTAIVTGAGVDTGSIVFRLEPAASLTGRVVNEFAEPVQGAQVTFYREGYEAGRREIKMHGSDETDFFGEFSVSELASGKYFIAVQATPWEAVAAAPPDPQSPFVTGVDPALDLAYPLTFYGDATKEDAATPILLKAGRRFRAEIHLSSVRAMRFTLRGISGGPPEMVSSLRTHVFDDFQQLPIQIQQAPDGGSTVTGLAAGRYEFETFQPSTNSSHHNTVDLTQGSAEVEPQDNLADGSILLNLVQESGEKMPPQSQVALVGAKLSTNPRQTVDDHGSASFTGISPDDYRFLISSGNRVWQIIAIEEGDRRLTENHRQLSAGESAVLKLIVAPTAQSVEGVAIRDGKPMAGAMILLVPVDMNTDLFRRDQSDLDGTFALLNVPAGRYIVVAIENGWSLEWAKPEVLARFLPNGTAVEIFSSDRALVQLQRPITVQ